MHTNGHGSELMFDLSVSIRVHPWPFILIDDLQQVRDLLHHAPKSRGVRPLHHLVQLSQSETFHHPLMLLGRTDRTAHQLDPDFAVLRHHSFSTAMPLNSATALFSRRDSSATIVALTTLCGFLRPMDLVSTFAIPQAEITARTAPPAITPVP